MAVVKIKYGPTRMFLSGQGAVDKVRAAIKEGLYTEESALFTVNGDSMDAADEVFDLTNNPSRQEERERVYGHGRSLSVGDIVVVGEEQWVCCSFGWQEI